MRKNLLPAGFAAAAVVLAAGMASCGGNKAEKHEDTVAVEEMVAAVEQASLDTTLRAYDAAFFNNPDKKSLSASTDSTYQVTESGLKYTVVKEGKGARPSASDNVTVHYTGRLTDGTVFDSSVERGEPTSFPLNRVIPGWTEGLQLMQEGGVTVFYIPSELGYGEMGTPGGPIPPNAPLIFEVELIKVN